MSTTTLGMPALPPRTAQPTWKQAWDDALYGRDGYLRSHPLQLGHDRGLLVDFVAGRAAGYDAVVLLGSAGLLAPDLGAAPFRFGHLCSGRPAARHHRT